MRRLLKFLRGMIGMGLTFAAGVSGVFSLIVVLKWLLLGSDLGHDMIETVLTGAAPAGFMVGVAFSCGLALYGRSRTLADLSLPKFVAFGALAGFLVRLPFADFTWTGVFLNNHLLTLIGAGGAAVVYGLARRGAAARHLNAGEDRGGLPRS